MSYVFRSIDMAAGAEIEPRVSVNVKDAYWPTPLDHYDLQFCSLNGRFFNPRNAPKRRDGDIVTGWYLPHSGGGVTANTYLTIFAYDRTSDRFLWPKNFVMATSGETRCPCVAATSAGPVSVELNRELGEYTKVKRVTLHVGRQAVVIEQVTTVKFAEMEIVIPVPVTLSEPRLDAVTGTCVAIAIYDERVERREISSHPQADEAHNPTIPWWEWPMKISRPRIQTFRHRPTNTKTHKQTAFVRPH